MTRSLSMIGLGYMGTAMTRRLLAHGWRVTVWNRTKEKAEPLIAEGAVWSDEPVAANDLVILSLYDSAAVAGVVTAMMNQFRPGQIVVDTTTGEPEASIAMEAKLAALGVRYLDAPISGSSEQTQNGEATVMVGGDKAAFDSLADLWAVLGRSVHHCGPSGSAAKMKLVTNVVLGLNRAVLAEGLAFAEAIGVDLSAALAVMKDSNAYSRAMDVKGRKMLAHDYTPQARLSQHLKDLKLIRAATDLDLPFVDVHARLLALAEARGLGDLDNSAIFEVLRRG